MAAEYEARIYNRSGSLQYVLVPRNGLLGLSYTRRINQVGVALVIVDIDNVAIANIDLDWQLQILRHDAAADIDWYTDFHGLFRGYTIQTDDNGITTYTMRFACINHWLARTIVGYKAGVNNRTQFNGVKAETIAKALVTRNATSSGTTADGRVRNVDSWGANISVQSDGATGNVLIYTCPYKPLLQALQELGDLGGGDFEIVRTGAQAWQFRWYDGFLGTDRSDTVVFSPDLDNMQNPVLTRDVMSEPTIAIVAGQETGSAREIEIVSSTSHNADYNSSEMFVDARDQGATYLEARGYARLEPLRARNKLAFDVLQTGASLYGKHYFLGDVVTGYYADTVDAKQVGGVAVTYQAGRTNPEEIRVELVDL